MKNNEELEFLAEYLNTAAPTGNEVAGQKVWMNYLKPYITKFITDSYGTAVGIINGRGIQGHFPYKVVIEAHSDEISWYVNHITSNGLLYVIRNGGSDQQIAPSKRVKIHTNNGLVDGLFGWPAIHTRKGDEVFPKLDNITIDVGCATAEEVEELGIHVGSIVTYPDEFMILNGNKYVGRALDNKMGGYMIAQVAKRLYDNKIELPFTLYVVNSVQEEIGLRGAQMIANTINPDLAIITDVCHDTSTPMINALKEGDTQIGKGPVVGYAPAIHNILRELIIDTAIDKEIPFQRMALSTSTGTDTDAFAYSNCGVPSALISLPLRYMHTTVEMTHKDDVENTINLIYETLLKIDVKKSFKYLENGN